MAEVLSALVYITASVNVRVLVALSYFALPDITPSIVVKFFSLSSVTVVPQTLRGRSCTALYVK